MPPRLGPPTPAPPAWLAGRPGWFIENVARYAATVATLERPEGALRVATMNGVDGAILGGFGLDDREGLAVWWQTAPPVPSERPRAARRAPRGPGAGSGAMLCPEATVNESVIEDILGRPDAAEVVAELRRRLAAREHAGLPIATRLAKAEKELAKAARLTRKAARMLPDDPLNWQFEGLHRHILRVLSDVRARLEAARA